MGKHYLVQILLTILLASLFLAVQSDRVFSKLSREPSRDLAGRARRFLQQSTALKEDDDVKSFCSDRDISFEELSITSSARMELKADLDKSLKSFRSIVDEVIEVIKSGDLNEGMGSRATNIVTKAPVIVLSILMLVIIVVLLLVLCVYGIIRCICSKSEDIDQVVVVVPNAGNQPSSNLYAAAADDWQSEDEREKAQDDQVNRQRQLQAQQEGETNRLQREEQWRREDEDSQSRRRQRREERNRHNAQRSQNHQASNSQSDRLQKLDEEMKTAKTRQNYTKYCSYACCLASVVITAVWFGYLARAVSNINDVKCSMAGLKGMALSGDVKTTDLKFIGVKPLQDLLTMYQDIILKETPPVFLAAGIAAITASSIKQTGTDLRTKLEDVPRLDKDLSYSGLDGSPVKPPSAKLVQDALSDSLRAEALNLHKTCLGIGSFAEYLAIQTAAGPVLVVAFEVYIRGLGLAVEPIQTFFDKMLKTSPRYISATQELAYVVLILLGIVIFLTLLAIAVVLYYLAKLIAILVPDNDEDKREEHRRDAGPNQRQQEHARDSARDGQHEDSFNHFAPNDQNQNRGQQRQAQDRQQPGNNTQKDQHNNQQQQFESRKPGADTSKAGSKCCQCLMRLQPLKVCQFVICSVMTVLSILTFLFAIASVFGVIGFYTGCEVSYGIGEKPGFIDEINKGEYFSKNTATLLKNCLAPGGNGDLGALIPTGIPPELKLVMDGLFGTALAVSNKSQLSGSPTQPPQGASLEVKVNDWAAMTQADSDQNPNDLDAALKKVNSNKCSQDSMNYNGKCSGTISTTADTATQSLGSQYCIDVSKVPSHNYDGRYAGQPASGYCTGAQSTTLGQDALKKASATASAYKASITSLKNKFDSFYTTEKQCFSKTKDALNSYNLQGIYDKYQTQCDRQFQLGNYNDLLNCQSFRKGHTAIERSLCYKMLGSLDAQSGLAFFDALLMFFAALSVFSSWFYSDKLVAAKESRDRLA